jgi:hypothetical protein
VIFKATAFTGAILQKKERVGERDRKYNGCFITRGRVRGSVSAVVWA